MGKNKKIDTIQMMFEKYLKMIGLPNEVELTRLNRVQAVETKRAYYGAICQLLIHQRDVLSNLDEEKAVQALEDLMSEGDAFWHAQEKKV